MKQVVKKKKFKYKKLVLILLYAIGILIFILPCFYFDVFSIFENKILDVRFKYFNQKKPVSNDIVYVDIDEDSIQKLVPFYGGWPWRRGDVISDRIISYIMQGDPSSFLFDILYVDITSKDRDEDINEQDLVLSDTTALFQYQGKNISHAILFSNDPLLFPTKILKDKFEDTVLKNIKNEDDKAFLLSYFKLNDEQTYFVLKDDIIASVKEYISVVFDKIGFSKDGTIPDIIEQDEFSNKILSKIKDKNEKKNILSYFIHNHKKEYVFNREIVSKIYKRLKEILDYTGYKDKAEIQPTQFGYDGFEIQVDDKNGYLEESEYNLVTLPFKELYHYTMQFHSVTHVEDIDGVSRNYKLIVKYNGKYYPSLALAAIIKKFNIVNIEIINKNLVLKAENNTEYRLKIDEKGIMPLSFYQDILEFNSIKASSVVISAEKQIKGIEIGDEDVNYDELKDKIIIMGGSAIGLKDIKTTPVDESIAGPFIHITAISNILMNHKIHRIPKPATMFIILFSVFVILLSSSMIKNTYVKNIIGFGYILSHIILTLLLFRYFGIVLELATTLIASLISYFGALIIVSLTEARDKKFLKSTFGSYLSPELIDEMFNNKETPTLGGESRQISAYFTDIQGFSTFSEKLTAVQLVELLNEYLSAMTDILLENKGTLDKYEGDAIIAFFGAPMRLPDNPVRACRVAINMQNKLLELRKKWESERQAEGEDNRNSKNLPPEEWHPGNKWPCIVHEMKMRIGINTGEIVVGNMGSKTRMNYTMMGDSVNLAARLEAGAKQYGVYTLVSEFTMNYEFEDESGRKRKVKEFFDYRYIDKIVVVGKSEPVVVYEVVAEKGKMSEKELELFRTYNHAVKLYLSQEWNEAIRYFKEALKIERVPDGKTTPSKVYIERCEHFKTNPPGQNWDGTWVLTSK